MVQRARAFERECLATAAGHRHEHPLGLWTRSSAHPGMWSLNQLHVVGRHPDLTTAGLMAELDAELGDAEHRRVTIDDDATGRRLAAGFVEAGWNVHALLVMLLDREPPEPPPGLAREVGPAEMAALDARLIAQDPDITAADRAVVLAGHAHIRAAVPGTRLFVGADDGVDACQTTLFTDGRTGQPENVSTLRAHEGRGLASAAVSVAARAALAGGCDLVFLLCAADTGPVPLYAGLGFRAAGRCWTFTRPG